MYHIKLHVYIEVLKKTYCSLRTEKELRTKADETAEKLIKRIVDIQNCPEEKQKRLEVEKELHLEVLTIILKL